MEESSNIASTLSQGPALKAITAWIPVGIDQRLKAEAFHSQRTKRDIIAAALDTYLLHCEASR